MRQTWHLLQGTYSPVKEADTKQCQKLKKGELELRRMPRGSMGCPKQGPPLRMQASHRATQDEQG